MRNAQRKAPSRWIFRPAVRLALGAVSAVITVGSVAIDQYWRTRFGWSPFGSFEMNLWMAIAGGAALGIVSAIQERLEIRRRYDELVQLHSAPMSERHTRAWAAANWRLNKWSWLAAIPLIIGTAIWLAVTPNKALIVPFFFAGCGIAWICNATATKRLYLDLRRIALDESDPEQAELRHAE